MAKRKFIEGKGWVITEDDQNETDAITIPTPKPGPARRVQLADVDDRLLEKVLASRNLVAVPADEYQALTQRIDELEKQLDHEAAEDPEPDEKPAAEQESKPATGGKKRGKGKGKTVTPEQIAAVSTLEELTDLMQEVKDEELLALADERAEAIKGETK
jgi:hypothetical protein